MNHIKLKQIIKKISIVLIICILFTGFIVLLSMASSEKVKSDDIIIKPADHEIVPIDDGNKIIEATPLMRIYLWRMEVASFVDSLFRNTEYRDFARLYIIPTLSTLLLGINLLPFLFSRRMFPEKNPNSSAAKILAYLKEHEGTTQQKIVNGVNLSRGSVAYQLKRFEKENKVYVCEYSGKKYYFTHPEPQDSVRCEILKILSDDSLSSIFMLLYKNQKLTRSDISECLGKSEDVVYYRLGKIGERVIISVREGHRNYYSLTKKARAEYEKIGDGGGNEL